MNIFRHHFSLAPMLMAALALVSCTNPEGPTTSWTPNNTSATDSKADGESFPAVKAASDALLAAAQAGDFDALRKIFGPAMDDLLSGDPTQDKVECANFAKTMAQMCKPVSLGEDKVVFYLGDQNWPFPIPLVKADGQWHFDTATGQQEVLARRIGKDELTAISVCRAYVDAQHEYITSLHDLDGVHQYAQRLNSTEGQHDGLYWDPVEGEDLSPLGPLVADAHDEGYSADKPVGRSAPYHGYYFKILKEQGAAAPGGKFSYVINGHMLAGFALVAYPAHWGESGIMTFIVNQEGVVYQSNLGPDSLDKARDLTVFNPDASWTPVADEGVALQ